MDVAREQGGADLPFKIIDSPANDVDGQFEPFRRGSETPATHYFQKNLAASQSVRLPIATDGVPPEERPFPALDAYIAPSAG
jgi:hypothetical protein